MSRLLSRNAIRRFDHEVFVMPGFNRSTAMRGPYACLAAAAGCTALADTLFYDRSLGISFIIFCSTVVTVSVCLSGRANRWPPASAGMIFVASQLPMIEHFDFLPFLFALVGPVSFVLIARKGRSIAWPQLIPLSAIVILSGFVRCALDFSRLGRLLANRYVPRTNGTPLTTWIVPLAVTAVFATLFYTANPLISERIALLGVPDLPDRSMVLRAIFWLFVFAAIWPMIRVRVPPGWTARHIPAAPSPQPTAARPDSLFGPTSIKRSLILFNGLFAVQTAMDLGYLWGGIALPDGMTYATYAHRGAYPLTVTALLAAAFVLIAHRSARSERIIRILLLAWTAQNILLVASSVLRLNLYVAAYSLTELRLIAFVWMLLVAVGLALIVVRIVRDKPSVWLVKTNAAALVLTLYASCFVDVPMTIATYNLHHARECGGTGQPLDVDYFLTLPAYTFLATTTCHVPPQVEARRDEWIAWLREPDWDWRLSGPDDWFSLAHVAQSDWRSWTFRQWRLERALARMTQTP
jgi:Domain of unknown function (DUF4173)